MACVYWLLLGDSYMSTLKHLSAVACFGGIPLRCVSGRAVCDTTSCTRVSGMCYCTITYYLLYHLQSHRVALSMYMIVLLLTCTSEKVRYAGVID